MSTPFYVLNCEEEFEKKIIQKFVSEYQKGRTPNPCIDCNRYMKFEHLFKEGQKRDCEILVTGHYARVLFDENTQKYQLWKGMDRSKDQSYVLYSLSQEQLAHIQFPLGVFSKEQIREIAVKNNLINATKKDSQDICFVEGGDYASIIEQYTGEVIGSGNFVNENGKILGTHQGYYNFTIGQRRGLGIAAANPLYVIRICPEKNQVVLGDLEDLHITDFYATDVNWIDEIGPTDSLNCTIRVRYQQKEVAAIVTYEREGFWKIKVEEAIRAVTRGQAVVFYKNDQVLGGGTLSQIN